MGLTGDERAAIDSASFSFKALGRAGKLQLNGTFWVSLRPALIFIFTLVLLTWWFRYDSNLTSMLLVLVANICLLALPTMGFLTMVVGILATAATSRVRPSAVLYWMWWPFWSCALSWGALVLAFLLGEYVWYELFQPYTLITRLQAYGMVDPARTPGDRLQDAGVIDFANGMGLDRARGGCFVNGRTYCVAPILMGGQLNNKTDGYDYFAVGTDCCSCPNQDFRCGEWNNPLAQGGLRSVDETSRPFYKLAVDDWAVTFGKKPRHPLYFEWVQNPRRKVSEMWANGMTYVVVPCLAVMPCLFLLVTALNTAFGILCRYDIAAPIETFMPPQGMGLWRTERAQGAAQQPPAATYGTGTV